ncbi:uncharacterized protein L201_003445 [Kwoniella dendrophila CBS 6074]|uniref:SHSP domain-containing protein n=1 Tax=Kwoniella dendrophila CBS 6074 TaxID=1295534 RepID=A0AAX4JUC2_9TREE
MFEFDGQVELENDHKSNTHGKASKTNTEQRIFAEIEREKVTGRFHRAGSTSSDQVDENSQSRIGFRDNLRKSFSRENSSRQGEDNGTYTCSAVITILSEDLTPYNIPAGETVRVKFPKLTFGNDNESNLTDETQMELTKPSEFKYHSDGGYQAVHTAYTRNPFRRNFRNSIIFPDMPASVTWRNGCAQVKLSLEIHEKISKVFKDS